MQWGVWCGLLSEWSGGGVPGGVGRRLWGEVGLVWVGLGGYDVIWEGGRENFAPSNFSFDSVWWLGMVG